MQFVAIIASDLDQFKCLAQTPRKRQSHDGKFRRPCANRRRSLPRPDADFAEESPGKKFRKTVISPGVRPGNTRHQDA